jgi:hypothetical protein
VAYLVYLYCGTGSSKIGLQFSHHCLFATLIYSRLFSQLGLYGGWPQKKRKPWRKSEAVKQ